jgi:hypothetical protein
VKTQQDVSKATSEINIDQNQTNWLLTTSPIFYWTPCRRERETITRAQRALEKFESFNPTTREQYRLLFTRIHIQTEDRYRLINISSNKTALRARASWTAAEKSTEAGTKAREQESGLGKENSKTLSRDRAGRRKAGVAWPDQRRQTPRSPPALGTRANRPETTKPEAHPKEKSLWVRGSKRSTSVRAEKTGEERRPGACAGPTNGFRTRTDHCCRTSSVGRETTGAKTRELGRRHSETRAWEKHWTSRANRKLRLRKIAAARTNSAEVSTTGNDDRRQELSRATKVKVATHEWEPEKCSPAARPKTIGRDRRGNRRTSWRTRLQWQHKHSGKNERRKQHENESGKRDLSSSGKNPTEKLAREKI